MLVRESYRHGGAADADCIDMSVNINPFGTPEAVKAAIRESAELACRYPDACCTELTELLGQMYGVPCEYVLCGNGANELIYNYAAALGEGKRALIIEPAFSEYERALSANGVRVSHRMGASAVSCGELEGIDAVFAASPSNPAGQLIEKADLERLLEMCLENGVKCLLDMCFYELTQQFDAGYIAELTKRFSNLTVLSAFTKTYAIPGVRLGFMLCSDADFLYEVSKRQPCWNVSVTAQNAGIACVRCTDYVQRSREYIAVGRTDLYEKLSNIVTRVYRSDANYILFYEPRLSSEALKAYRISVRDCSDYFGLGKGYFRTCVGLHENNEALVGAIKAILGKQTQQLNCEV